MPAADMNSIREYHRRELEIALSPSHPGRIQPIIPEHCTHVLDVGCGAGQTLIALQLPQNTCAYGVDEDFQALQLGREMSKSICFICARGEALPFRDASFDFVFSRVALPYMNIPAALSEISRVLKAGGFFWVVLHPFRMALEDWKKAVVQLRPKAILYRSYVLFNGVMFHCLGRLFAFGKFESFQTVNAMRRTLVSLGFVDVQVQRGKHFVVTARKSAVPAST